MRLVDPHAAHRALGDHLLHRGEVAGVAAILVDGHYALLLFGQPHQLLGFRHRDRERLVDDDMMAGEHALLRDGVMRCIRCGDHDEIDLAGQ